MQLGRRLRSAGFVAMVGLCCSGLTCGAAHARDVRANSIILDLIDRGRAGKDPLLLVTAAHLLRKQGAETEPVVMMLHDEARVLNGGQSLVAGMIAIYGNLVPKGPVGGSKVLEVSLDAEQSWQETVELLADESITVTLFSDASVHARDLEVTLARADGRGLNNICSTIIPHNTRLCDAPEVDGGEYKLKVINKAKAPLKFKLWLQ